MIAPEPSFQHIIRLTDRHGTFEHADHTTPRRDHGYCTDDMARLLVVTSREPTLDDGVEGLQVEALRFVIDAQGPRGDVRNRMTSDGRWQGPWVTEDCWGRSLWGLGTAAARAKNQLTRELALAAFERGTKIRSRWPRAMAFAVFGAAEVMSAVPGHEQARALMVDAVGAVGRRGSDPTWPWPEPRLTYANAVLPEAMIAAGAALDRAELLRDGLELLGWLLDRETRDDHLSVTPVGGAAPDDCKPAFDQQPIEVAAIADACERAALIDESMQWLEGLRRAVNWFLGDNDAQAPMWNSQSDGGYDGLRPDGPNLNQGAESTLALISTLQHARDLIARPPATIRS
jgi:hypothetical protein